MKVNTEISCTIVQHLLVQLMTKIDLDTFFDKEDIKEMSIVIYESQLTIELEVDTKKIRANVGITGITVDRDWNIEGWNDPVIRIR